MTGPLNLIQLKGLIESRGRAGGEEPRKCNRSHHTEKLDREEGGRGDQGKYSREFENARSIT